MTIALHVNTNVRNKNKSKNKKVRNTMSKQYIMSREIAIYLCILYCSVFELPWSPTSK